MAQVYKSVGRYSLEKAMGLQVDVRDALDRAALEMGVEAEGILAGHRDAGNARIEVENDKGYVDVYVTLNDEDGLEAAMSIEYGKEGVSDGLYVLHRAAGISVKPRKGKKKK